MHLSTVFDNNTAHVQNWPHVGLVPHLMLQCIVKKQVRNAEMREREKKQGKEKENQRERERIESIRKEKTEL